MSQNPIMEYLGLSGGAITIITALLVLARKLCRSRCIRKDDGSMALELSLSHEDISTIKDNKELQQLFNSLKQEINKQKDGRTATVAPAPPV
jgi:hypothetical protein